MAKAVIRDVKDYRVGFIKEEKTHRVKFIDIPGTVKINQVLPFRVKFINIGINAYGPGNAAPIGIAIIGLNNYVM